MEQKKPVIIVADTTVIFSALTYDGLERRLLESDAFKFMVTRNVFDELHNVLEIKLGLSDDFVSSKLDNAPLNVVEPNMFTHNMYKAEKMIGFRDTSDVPTVALALSVPNDGIWSSDKDFEVLKGVKIWSSRELLESSGCSKV